MTYLWGYAFEPKVRNSAHEEFGAIDILYPDDEEEALLTSGYSLRSCFLHFAYNSEQRMGK